MRPNVITVIDGAAGSCGKGKIIGEIATDTSIKLGAAITNCMPNAGHTFVSKRGKVRVFRNIPVSSVNRQTELFIGPGSAIDMKEFKKEYAEHRDLIGDRKIYVHEMVPLIEQRHKDYEREHIKSGSTFKGCGAVSQEKIMRDKKLEFFRTFRNAVVCSNDEWLERIYAHLDDPFEYVMLEGSQGCDLSLNHSGNYPYVTGRNVSTAQLLADSGISPQRLLETIMVIRPFPIRISNVTTDGRVIYTGGYGSGAPLTWSEINIASLYGGYPFPGDVEHRHYRLDIERIKKLVAHTPEVFLKQLFGESYRSKTLESITLLEALELERLMYKSRGFSEYESQILRIESWECDDYPPNTIIDQSETTTVTKMERRVFDLDIKKLQNNCRINEPYGLYLNFFQHLDYYAKGRTKNFDEIYFDKYIREYLRWLESETDTPILALGTGARNGERILKQDLIKRM